MQAFAGELTVKLYSQCHSVTSVVMTDSDFQGCPSPNGGPNQDCHVLIGQTVMATMCVLHISLKMGPLREC